VVKIIFRPGGCSILSHEREGKDNFLLVGVILAIVDIKVGRDGFQPSIGILTRTVKLGDLELEFFRVSGHVGRRSNWWYDWRREHDRWYWIGDVLGSGEKWS
jgi:hypothetical protein